MATPFLMIGACALAITIACADEARAQVTGSERPYKGVFGSTRQSDSQSASAHNHQSLTLTTTIAAAYDDNLFADVSSVTDPSTPMVSGSYGMFGADVAYGWNGQRLHVGATGSSALRYYTELRQLKSSSHTAGVGFSARFARRTTLFVNQTLAYSPSYLYSLFPTTASLGPGEVEPSAPNYAANDSESVSYGTTVSLAHGLTKSTSLAVGGDFQRTNYLNEFFFRRDMTSSGVDAGITRKLSRRSALSINYRLRSSDYYFSLGRRTIEQGLNARMDYSRALSETRRATFSATVGATNMDVPVALDQAATFEQQFRFLGDGSVTYQFSRSWQAAGSYSRRVEYVPGLRTPLYATGGSAAVNGYFNSRWDLSMMAGLSGGEPTYKSTGSTYSTYTANVRSRYAFNREWAAYIEYLYYYYDFRKTLQTPIGTPPMLERNALRVGLTIWIPVGLK